MFDPDMLARAKELLSLCRQENLKLASAESCTGGLIAGLFTEIAGSSDVFERGFVTYSNEAKSELLGVPMEMIAEFGAVSEQVARSMVMGALNNSRADLAVSVTGIAGPGGGSAEKPVGLVYLAVALKGGAVISQGCQFGDPGRTKIRKATLIEALHLLKTTIESKNA